MRTQDSFREDLQDALNYLHDPDRLERSPLADLFGVAGRRSAYLELHDILTQAIAALRPGPEAPANSRAWRIYELLHCRYVQELSPPEVAYQLSLSVRHMHREQAAALDRLAQHLWRDFDLGGRASAAGDAAAREAEPEAEVADPGETSLKNELTWLRDVTINHATDLDDTLGAVVELTRALAGQHGVRLAVSRTEGLPGLAVHAVGLNQVLLNVLAASIHRAQGGVVQVTTNQNDWEVAIEIRSAPSTELAVPLSGESQHLLEAAKDLADLCGIRLGISPADPCFCVQVVAPAYQQVVVLAIDDNLDTLHLLERYTVGTKYRLVGLVDPGQALAIAERVEPQIVLLDVMMPQVDGWRVLGRLRSDPATSRVPIVVCSILDQDELAFTLGAAACLRKPFTQHAFLEVLDAHLAPPARGSQ